MGRSDLYRYICSSGKRNCEWSIEQSREKANDNLTEYIYVWYIDFANQHFKGVIMAVEFFVTKNGHAVANALVYYSKSAGWGERRTDANGYASFAIDPGHATCIRINGKDQGRRYLEKGVNEFKI